MAEAEDVITDAARHVTIYAQRLWRRHRKPAPGPRVLALPDVAQRLDLLVSAAFGRGFAIRAAQPVAPPSFLARLFRRSAVPYSELPIAATDGRALWLPPQLRFGQAAFGDAPFELYRLLAMRLAVLCQRDSAAHVGRLHTPWQQALFTVLETDAADRALVAQLPGLRGAVERLRALCLQSRPGLDRFAPAAHPLERLVRELLARDLAQSAAPPSATCFDDTLRLAAQQARETPALAPFLRSPRSSVQHLLYRDGWIMALRAPPDFPSLHASRASALTEPPGNPTRSARLPRRPEERKALEDEDDEKTGAWMVQTAQPHEQAEDPFGMQRPTDRDASTAADEYADALSELAEARLVSTPERAPEVLLSDDPPQPRARSAMRSDQSAAGWLHYPEWDWRTRAYRHPGARALLLPATEGPQQWIEDTLHAHRAMLTQVQRRFEMLRARRVTLRRQLDGEDTDLAAYVESRADFLAGAPLSQTLYQSTRAIRRDMAIVLLIDTSGSTDAWVSGNKRIIDVAREALLLVSIALQRMGEPYAILAFSGEGPLAVTLRTVKDFKEAHGEQVARRIAALEPEHYTRAGAALRHATALLMQQSAQHRLLLLLSDGKPNDMDEYEGRYGVEDMRQAVTEAKLQGIQPFCLTVDRQAASYLPAVFGPRQYALLQQPERLPAVLLDWMKRLLAH